MTIPEKLIMNGDLMMDEMNLDMAAFYYETAAEKYLEAGAPTAAIEAYDKVVHCFEMDDKMDRAQAIKEKITQIKAQIQ